MKQSRRASFAEATTNTLVGYGVAIAAQVAIFPLFGIYISVADHAVIGLLFTAVSLVRSYVLRRLFEALRVSEVWA